MYLCNGSDTDFSFAWPYLGLDDWDGQKSRYIKIWKNGVEVTTWTQIGAQQIRMNTAPAINDCLTIRRDSDITSIAHEFISGARNTARSQQFQSRKLFYLLQEIDDRGLDSDEVFNDGSNFNTYYFDGDGIIDTFALENDDNFENNVTNVSEILVLINGAAQHPDHYTLSEIDGVSNITFRLPPFDGTRISVTTMTSGVAQPLGNIEDESIDGDKLMTCAIDADNFERIICLDDYAVTGAIFIWVEGTGGPELIARIPTAEDISDFTEAVQEIPINTLASPTGNLSLNSHKITNLAAPDDPHDAVNLETLENAIDEVNDGGVIPQGASGLVFLGPQNEIRTVDVGFDWDYLIFSVKSLNYFKDNNGEDIAILMPRTYIQHKDQGDSYITYQYGSGTFFGGQYFYRLMVRRIDNGFNYANTGLSLNDGGSFFYVAGKYTA